MSYLINEDNIYFHVCHRKNEGHDWSKVADDESASSLPEGGGGGVSRELSLAVEKALLEMSVLCTKKAQVQEEEEEEEKW